MVVRLQDEQTQLKAKGPGLRQRTGGIWVPVPNIPDLSIRDEVMADGPLGYWPLDDATARVDESGGGNDLIAWSVTPSLQVDGPGGGLAVGLAGNTRSAANDGGGLFRPATFTAEFWAYKSVSGILSALSHSSGGNPAAWCFDTYQDRWRFLMTDADGNAWHGAQDAPSSIPLDTWQHIVGQFDASDVNSAKLWVDGVLIATNNMGTSGSRYVGSTELRVGEYNGTFHQYWNGRLAHVAVYDEYLSEARIVAHYNAGVV